MLFVLALIAVRHRCDGGYEQGQARSYFGVFLPASIAVDTGCTKKFDS